MNARTTLSAEGQVVIPKDVRERLRLAAGDQLDVVERPDGVLLRRTGYRKSGRSTDEIMAEIASIAAKYTGPPVSLEEIDEAIAEGWACGFREAR